MEKYYNDAIIGNKAITASYTNKGELLRLFYPNNDYRQFIDFFHTGIKINDSRMIYLHDDINNLYKQYYTDDTNVLNTEIFNTYFKIKMEQTDFVPVKENVLVKKYKFTNENSIDLDLNFLIYSKLLTDKNNQVSGYFKDNTLLQYSHDYTVSMFSPTQVENVQINNTSANIDDGVIGGKDYIGMSPDSSISYNLGTLKPREKRELVVYIYVLEKQNISQLDSDIARIKKLDVQKELDTTKRYWRNYIKSHDGLSLNLPITPRNQKIEKIYKRTILLYPLLTNFQTGGISAAVEVDENRTKCGRYSYCWTRDAIFITEAMDILKMTKETEKFYKSFCKNTQSKSGRWEQRFYTDGTLAPCWGYQIDETASVVYGVYNHYKKTNDIKFLKDNLKMCEKAIHYLEKYTERVLSGKEEEYLSYDIWEENEGIHTYSLCAIFAAFQAFIKIYEDIKPEYKENRIKLEQIQNRIIQLDKYVRELKGYVLKNLYDNNRKTLIRNKDGKIDISIIGSVTPFKMFEPAEKKITNTVERINMTLRTYTGGYLRYEGDTYIGGNPWTIANLWLANYYIEAGEKKKAKECFDFVVNTVSQHGFIPEQIDNKTMSMAWVNGLGWAHALFIIVLSKLL